MTEKEFHTVCNVSLWMISPSIPNIMTRKKDKSFEKRYVHKPHSAV